MSIITANDIWDDLCKLIRMPEGCTKVVITLESRHVVTMDVTTIAREGSREPVEKQYHLVEVE